MIALGDKVRVKHPTGGVRRGDVFVVVERPADRRQFEGMVWVEYDGPRDSMRPWTIFGRVMGFAPSSLEEEQCPAAALEARLNRPFGEEEE